MAQALPHPIMYATAGQQVNQYSPQYYTTALSAPSSYGQYSPFVDRHRPERRRPKYTRSKTGCLTCRRKKVKCDETKPMCQRCQNSQLDCSWPEIVPPKKKVQPRRKCSPLDQELDISRADLQPSPMSSLASQNQLKLESPQSVPLANLPELSMAVGNDRRHSAPLLHMPPSDAAMAERRHTVPDIADPQFGQSYHDSISGGGVVNNAMGLNTMRRFNNAMVSSSVRASTPNELVYAQQQQQFANPYSPYTAAGALQLLPSINNSRPSTASSMPPLAHSISRSTSLSRPSTASGYTPQQVQQFAHRPHSSSGGSDESILHGFTPGSFQLQGGGSGGSTGARGREYEGAMASTDMSPYVSGFSRPSAANSPASSPYIRHVAHLSEAAGGERWQPSPLSRPSPLANAVQNQLSDGYCQPSLHPTPQHSRPQSPWDC